MPAAKLRGIGGGGAGRRRTRSSLALRKLSRGMTIFAADLEFAVEGELPAPRWDSFDFGGGDAKGHAANGADVGGDVFADRAVAAGEAAFSRWAIAFGVDFVVEGLGRGRLV